MKDDFLENIDFYERLYQTEIERIKFYDKVIQYPTTVLIIAFSAFFFSLNNYFTNGQIRIEKCIDYIFVTLAIFFILTTVITIYLLIKVFHGMRRKYKYIPYSNELLDHERNLIKHYFEESDKKSKKERLKEAKVKAMKQFTFNLKNQYAEFCEFNQRINDNRAKYYYYTKTLIVINLSLLAVIGIIGNI